MGHVGEGLWVFGGTEGSEGERRRGCGGLRVTWIPCVHASSAGVVLLSTVEMFCGVPWCLLDYLLVHSG